MHILFDKELVQDTLGETVSKAGKHQLRIAETEKYAHVTFFFNGGRETVFENEDRILVNSPKVPTYDLLPQMSAPEVAEKLIDQIRSEKQDMIILNFANCDMVGHTGIFDAAVKAVEAVDSTLIVHIETAPDCSVGLNYKVGFSVGIDVVKSFTINDTAFGGACFGGLLSGSQLCGFG